MKHAAWKFHGGIHPPANKQQSLDHTIQSAEIPPLLILPLGEPGDPPASPCVAVGDKVLKGQLIADADGIMGVPVHAPSSGTITAIGDHLLPHESGLSGPCITLATDGQDQWLPHEGLTDYRQASPHALLKRIRDAGICGMGGGGFPAAIKLNPPDGKIITTLIINGAECEPYVTADEALMRERAEEIILGTLIMAHLLNPRKILIGIEDNKAEAIAAMNTALHKAVPDIPETVQLEIITFPPKYPSGSENQLIEILTGKQVPSSGIPADIGIVCHNTGTAAAVCRAITHGEPLLSRIVTVTGNAIIRPGNFEVLAGTPISHLLALAGYDETRNERLILGGPLTGFILSSTDIPVINTTHCLLAPTPEELPAQPPAKPCIRCNFCAQVCPAILLPQQLFWHAQARDYEKLEKYNLLDCIECGACAYVCPSNIPLVQYYRASKTSIRIVQENHGKAAHSRQRFENRNVRLAIQQAEKEASRLARIEAAKNRNITKEAAKETAKQAGLQAGGKKTADDHADLIQAAIARVKAKKAAAASNEQPARHTGDRQSGSDAD